MEQKRIFWIVAAVGVFLLVVVGAALILYTPVRPKDPILTAGQYDSDTWLKVQPTQKTVEVTDNLTSDSTEEPKVEKNPGTAPLEIEDLTVISKNTTVYSSEKTTIDLTQESEKTVANTQTSVSETTKTEPVVVAPVVSVTPSQKTTAAGNTSVAPKTTVKDTISTKKTSKTTTVKNTTAIPTQPKETYWVQAASFTNIRNAEEARKQLAAEKISSEVFTYSDTKGTTYYRVRVGPYTTKSEAEYWNTRIKLIDAFAKTESYVTNSSQKIK